MLVQWICDVIPSVGTLLTIGIEEVEWECGQKEHGTCRKIERGPTTEMAPQLEPPDFPHEAQLV